MVTVNINDLYRQAQEAVTAKHESISIRPEQMKVLLEVYMQQEQTIDFLEKLIIKIARN